MKINTTSLRNLSKEKYLAYIHALPNFREEKIQTYAMLILTLFAISFFGIFAVSPTLSTIGELRKKLEDSSFVNDQLQTKIANMTKLQQEFNSLSPELPILYAAIPQAPDAGKLSGQIRSLATQHKVTLDELQIQSAEIATPGKPRSILQPMKLHIGVQGTLEDIRSFYDSLVDFDRVVTLTTLTVVVPSRANASNYRLTVEGQAYFKP